MPFTSIRCMSQCGTTLPACCKLILGSLKVLLFGHLLGYLLGYLFDKENKKESYK